MQKYLQVKKRKCGKCFTIGEVVVCGFRRKDRRPIGDETVVGYVCKNCGRIKPVTMEEVENIKFLPNWFS